MPRVWSLLHLRRAGYRGQRRQRLQEHIYRLRGVEAWSVGIPWGLPLADMLKRFVPKSQARYVELRIQKHQVESLYPFDRNAAPDDMAIARTAGIRLLLQCDSEGGPPALESSVGMPVILNAVSPQPHPHKNV